MITVAACFAASNAELPRHLPTTAAAPIPRPIARLVTVNVTGQVKLIAVSESVPRKLMNQVSTRLEREVLYVEKDIISKIDIDTLLFTN